MFGFLWQDAADAEVAEAASVAEAAEVADAASASDAEVEAAEDRPRRAKRGRRPGYKLSELTIAKIRAARYATVAKKLQQKQQKVSASLAPSLQVRASEVSMGHDIAKREKEIAVVIDASGDISRVAKDAKRQRCRFTIRGVVSHVQGTQLQLPRFIAGSQTLIVISVLDDANIWVKRPPDTLDPKTHQSMGRKACEQTWQECAQVSIECCSDCCCAAARHSENVSSACSYPSASTRQLGNHSPSVGPLVDMVRRWCWLQAPKGCGCGGASFRLGRW